VRGNDKRMRYHVLKNFWDSILVGNKCLTTLGRLGRADVKKQDPQVQVPSLIPMLLPQSKWTSCHKLEIS
jgi:hypothetical protein